MASLRISPEEANARALAGEPIVIVDSRNSKAWQESDQKIPGAIRVPVEDIEDHLDEIDPDAAVIVYCTCPEEASSLKVAKALSAHQFERVWALRGGMDAWKAAEYPLESKPKAA